MIVATLLQHFLNFIIILLFCAAAAVLYRWLFPRYLLFARVLASSFLGAQALTTVMAEATQPSTAFARWFWDLDTEWNFSTTLAATQLTLVGALALSIAWLSVKRPVWQRVYFVGVAAFFFYLGHDEFSMIHEWVFDWEYRYMAVGAALTVMMAAVFWRSSRLEKLFAACIPVGLALAAFGAMFFDVNSIPCRAWGRIFVFGECVIVYTMEESLEFLGIWVALVGSLGLVSNLSPTPNALYRRAFYALPIFLVLLLCSSGAVIPISQQGADGAAISGEGVQLHGYEIVVGKQSVQVHLFLTPEGWQFDGLGYSISLIDQARLNVYAARDRFANKSLNFLLAPGYIPVWRQWLELEFPPDTRPNRAMWIVLSFWREEDGEFIPQSILSSDHPLLGDAQVVLDEIVLRAPRQDSTDYETLATFDNGYILEAAAWPESVVAGGDLAIKFSWRSAVREPLDYAQFLHLRHEDSGEWYVYDQNPLGTRLPTRLWYRGLADSETWAIPLPEDLTPGRHAVFTGLYRSSDKERVVATDANGKPFLDARISLGNLDVIKE